MKFHLKIWENCSPKLKSLTRSLRRERRMVEPFENVKAHWMNYLGMC